MDESNVDRSPGESLPASTSVLRYGTIVASLLVGLSYALPWIQINGPVIESEREAGTETQLVPETVSISANEVPVIPELLAGIAVVTVLVAVVRWNMVLQAVTGLLGLVGSGLVLYVWAGLGVGDDARYIEIGPYVGPPSSFDPAIGLWIGLIGALLLVVFGSGTAVSEYVKRLETDDDFRR